MAFLLHGYTYPHGWVSAHESVMAMQFASHGVVALGGVPIQNAGPLTTEPDVYLNWPPLYPILLSFVVRSLGASEFVHHAVAALLVLTTAAILFAIVRRNASQLAACTAVIAYLAAPVVTWFGQAGLHLHLALLATMLGLACFGRAIDSGAIRRLWALAAVCCFVLASFTSWEPCLATPGLVAVALLRRDRCGLRLAIAVGIVAGFAVIGVFALYWVSYSHAIEAVFHRAMLRAGLTDNAIGTLLVPPHLLSDSLEPAGIPTRYPAILLERLMSVGFLGMSGLVLGAIYLRSALADKAALCFAIGGMASIGIAWSIAMANHMAIHSYQALIFAPLAALVTGAMVEYLTRADVVRTLRYLPAVLLVGLLGRFVAMNELLIVNRHETPLIQFAREVRAASEPNAIVVSPDRDMVFVYYSQRHIIRGMTNQRVLDREKRRIDALCPTCPLYLAIPAGQGNGFPRLTAQTPSSDFPNPGTLYRLRPGTDDP